MLQQFLAELRSRDIEIWADGDRLRCTAPAGVLTPELRQELQQRKGEILAFLRSGEALARQPRAIVPLEPRGTRIPIFGVAGHNGDVFCYRALAQHLGEDQPFFGLEPPGLDGRSEPLTRVEDLAGYFVDQIRAFQPTGTCIIAGFCAGGTVAFELGRQLLQRGANVGLVALFGSPDPTWYRPPAQLGWRLRQQLNRFGAHARALRLLSLRELGRYVAEKVRQRKAQRDTEQAAALDPVLVRRAKVQRATIAAVRRYTPAPFAGRLGLFLPSEGWLPSATSRWASLAGRSDVYVGPEGCDNDTMLREPYAAQFAILFRRAEAERAEGRAPRSSGALGGPLLATGSTH
jgi:thioesterase domain-containing protein